MIVYAICGLAACVVLLAMEYRLLLRIWSRLRWTHPSVHELGTMLAPVKKVKTSTMLRMEDFPAKNGRESERAISRRRGEPQ